jgi:uncharacterized membrane protein YjjB (DUF3815 family)
MAWAVLLEHALWAAVAALGFAVLFNVPPRALAPAALCGALAFASRALCVELRLCSLELATFFAATLVSVTATAVGKQLRAPAVVFVVPAVIPLVPGALAFRSTAALLALASREGAVDPAALATVAVGGVRAAVVTLAMAFGVAVPSLILRRRGPMT